jgi:hypothetical protein
VLAVLAVPRTRLAKTKRSILLNGSHLTSTLLSIGYITTTPFSFLSTHLYWQHHNNICLICRYIYPCIFMQTFHSHFEAIEYVGSLFFYGSE